MMVFWSWCRTSISLIKADENYDKYQLEGKIEIDHDGHC